MSLLAEREPRRVFYHFENICSIPHGSGNEKQISEYLVSFAKKNGLRYRQDEKWNVIIWKDGFPGFENAAPVILQGHMDMVAVKEKGVVKELETEGLDLDIDGDMLFARGTSLGADDGIGVAYMLALLEDDSLVHPPIEAVFTSREEVDLQGARYLDVSDLSGRTMINLDTEKEGVFMVSCAGGALARLHFPCEREELPSEAVRLKLRLYGLTGGHSGTEIHLGHLNANMTMGRILYNLSRSMDIRLISIDGGEKDNAIPQYCEAIIAVPQLSDEAVLSKAVSSEVPASAAGRAEALAHIIFTTIKEENSTVEPNMKLDVSPEDREGLIPMSKTAGDDILCALMVLPGGVQKMSPDLTGVVRTSLNLGILSTDEDEVIMSYCVRSSVETEKRNLLDKLRVLTERLSGTVEVSRSYPGWYYMQHSLIRDLMKEVYRGLYGKDPLIRATHGGLECGLFCKKIQGLDAISIGPDLYNIHTTSEKVGMESVGRTYDLLLYTLKELAELSI